MAPHPTLVRGALLDGDAGTLPVHRGYPLRTLVGTPPNTVTYKRRGENGVWCTSGVVSQQHPRQVQQLRLLKVRRNAPVQLGVDPMFTYSRSCESPAMGSARFVSKKQQVQQLRVMSSWHAAVEEDVQPVRVLSQDVGFGVSRSSSDAKAAIDQDVVSFGVEDDVKAKVSAMMVSKSSPAVLIWRCRHPHGLFSMLSLALGHLQQCLASGTCLLVDWTWSGLLYAGPSWESNLWCVFYYQPAELAVSHNALVSTLKQGNYSETATHEVAFGDYKGVIQGAGTISRQQASQGRALCRQWLVLRKEFREKLEQRISQLLGGCRRWLAVHVRRGDKGIEASANIDLTEDMIFDRTVAQCAMWGCDGVFLCSDDARLKERLTQRIRATFGHRGHHLLVSTHASTLTGKDGAGTHFDESLDKYQKAEDVMIEAYVMALGCVGLLCTYSNVSASVVYFSPEEYLYTTFWE